MKKIVSLLLICGLLLNLTIVSFAKTDTSLSATVYDTENLSSKSFSPKLLNNNNTFILAVTPAAPSWNCSVTPYYDGVIFGNCYGGIAVSDSYTDSSHNTRYAIDHIAAKSRVYDKSGALLASKNDDEKNASHAGCEALYSKYVDPGSTLYGNHIFEKSGFQSWYPETHATV